VLFDAISATHAMNPSLDTRIVRHTRILEGIQQHNPERAYQAMRDHLDETKVLIELVEVTGGDFREGGLSATSR